MQCLAADVAGFHSCTMWAGCGGGCTPTHFDGMSNFFAQIVGRKRCPALSGPLQQHSSEHCSSNTVLLCITAPRRKRRRFLLFDPGRFGHLYPHSQSHPCDSYAVRRALQVDTSLASLQVTSRSYSASHARCAKLATLASSGQGVDVEAPDLRSHPALRRARAIETTRGAKLV